MRNKIQIAKQIAQKPRKTQQSRPGSLTQPRGGFVFPTQGQLIANSQLTAPAPSGSLRRRKLPPVRPGAGRRHLQAPQAPAVLINAPSPAWLAADRRPIFAASWAKVAPIAGWSLPCGGSRPAALARLPACSPPPGVPPRVGRSHGFRGRLRAAVVAALAAPRRGRTAPPLRGPASRAPAPAAASPARTGASAARPRAGSPCGPLPPPPPNARPSRGWLGAGGFASQRPRRGVQFRQIAP